MTMIKLFSVCALAVLLGSWGVAPILADGRDGGAAESSVDQAKLTALRDALRASGAEVVFSGSLSCGDCVDVYQVFCKGKSRYACANIQDAGGFFDVQFSVTVVGQAPPGPLVGQADNEVAPDGGTSFFACVVRPTPAAGAMKALVVISEADKPGSENYNSDIFCADDFFFGTPFTITTKQDQ